jgi:hypothetical protein
MIGKYHYYGKMGSALDIGKNHSLRNGKTGNLTGPRVYPWVSIEVNAIEEYYEEEKRKRGYS